jgi:hypothetical protein
LKQGQQTDQVSRGAEDREKKKKQDESTLAFAADVR